MLRRVMQKKRCEIGKKLRKNWWGARDGRLEIRKIGAIGLCAVQGTSGPLN